MLIPRTTAARAERSHAAAGVGSTERVLLSGALRAMLGVAVLGMMISCGRNQDPAGPSRPSGTRAAPRRVGPRAGPHRGTVGAAAPQSGPLPGLLGAVPPDAIWGVAIAPVGPALRWADPLVRLIARHPRLRKEVLALRSRIRTRLGFWPLEAKERARVGLGDESHFVVAALPTDPSARRTERPRAAPSILFVCARPGLARSWAGGLPVAGASHLPHVAGASHLPHAAGASHLPHAAGASHLPHAAGASHLPHAAGASHLPHAAGASHLPHAAGASHLPHAAGASHLPHAAGASHLPHAAGASHLPHVAGASHPPHAAGASHLPRVHPARPQAWHCQRLPQRRGGTLTCCAPLPREALAKRMKALSRRSLGSTLPSWGPLRAPSTSAVLYLSPSILLHAAEQIRAATGRIFDPAATSPGPGPSRSRALLALSTAPRLRVQGILFPDRSLPSPPPLPAPPQRDPYPFARPPSSAALAALDAPDLRLRIVLPEKPMASLVKRIRIHAPWLDPLLSPSANTGERPLTGALELWSSRHGIAVSLGVNTRARMKDALARASLRLSTQLPDWQRRVRQRGPRWNLTLRRHPQPLPGTTCLTWHGSQSAWFPMGPPDFTARVCYALGRRQLALGTSPALARGAATLDEPLLGGHVSPGAGSAQVPSRRGPRIDVWFRPMDPLLDSDPMGAGPPPPRQRHRLAKKGIARKRQADPWQGVPGTWRSPLLLFRVASDLIGRIEASFWRTDHAWHLDARITLPHGPRGPLALPRDYQALLVHKWSGHRAGFRSDLERLRREATDTPVHRKVEALLGSLSQAHLPHDRPGGYLSLLLHVALPALVHRMACRRLRATRDRVGVILSRLRRAVESTGSLGSRGRRRALRHLRSTPFTPARPCCHFPARTCPPRPDAWRHPTWTSLSFRLRKPHLFRYRILATHTSMRSRFTVEAEGDPMCTGQLFRLEQAIDLDRRDGAMHMGPLHLRAPVSDPNEQATCLRPALRRK